MIYNINDVLIVIVIYDIKVKESQTINTLFESWSHFKNNDTDKIDLIVYDNSYSRSDFNDFNRDNVDVIYIHNALNPGVSKAYNESALIAKEKKKKYIIILDQDTSLPKNFLLEYISAINFYKGYAIYAPKLIDKNMLISPCKYLYKRGINLKDVNEGINDLKNINFLNSGLLIDLDAYMDVDGYDESIRLYFSDFVFIDKIRKKYDLYVLINCELNHSLSSNDYSKLCDSKIRFKYYCEGAKQASNNWKSWIQYFITVGLRSFKMSKRLDSIDFVKIFMVNFIFGRKKL